MIYSNRIDACVEDAKGGKEGLQEEYMMLQNTYLFT